MALDGRSARPGQAESARWAGGCRCQGWGPLMLSPAHEGLRGAGLCLAASSSLLHSSVAETAGGSGLCAILLVDPATFRGHGSSMQLALASTLSPALRPPSPSCCPAGHPARPSPTWTP